MSGELPAAGPFSNAQARTNVVQAWEAQLLPAVGLKLGFAGPRPSTPGMFVVPLASWACRAWGLVGSPETLRAGEGMLGGPALCPGPKVRRIGVVDTVPRDGEPALTQAA